MHIYGPAHLHGPQSISAPHTTRAGQAPQRPASSPIQDEVEISEAARLAEQAAESAGIRQDRVSAIREQIAQGTYETPEKLDAALERLLDELV